MPYGHNYHTVVLANSKINFIRPADVHQIFVGDERFYGVRPRFNFMIILRIQNYKMIIKLNRGVTLKTLISDKLFDDLWELIMSNRVTVMREETVKLMFIHQKLTMFPICVNILNCK